MKSKNRTIATIAVAAVFLLILAAAPSATADRKPGWKGEEGQPRFALPVDEVTIEKKTLNEVITNTGREYALSTGTIIVDPDGQQVSIRKMLVPCEAEVTYSGSGNKREATRIQVKLVHSNASWQWTAKEAE